MPAFVGIGQLNGNGAGKRTRAELSDTSCGSRSVAPVFAGEEILPSRPLSLSLFALNSVSLKPCLPSTTFSLFALNHVCPQTQLTPSSSLPGEILSLVDAVNYKLGAAAKQVPLDIEDEEQFCLPSTNTLLPPTRYRSTSRTRNSSRQWRPRRTKRTAS
jgi:hypothetical protein